MLEQKLLQKGLRFLSLREPGGTAAGEAVRQVLLDKRLCLSTEAELLLYMAARTELVSQVLKPALKDNLVVLCDRFADSTFAYQGYGGGADLNFIKLLNDQATKGLRPDLTILLDLPVEEALKRKKEEKDRMESKDYYFHSRVRQGYLALARQEPQRFVVINAMAPAQVIHEKLMALIWPLVSGAERS